MWKGVPCQRGRSPVLARPQAASQARQRHLSSLQDYMQRCTNELYWLDQQARGRIQYDWSDRNLSYPSRRRQYEVGAGLWGCGLGALKERGAARLGTEPLRCLHCRISSIGTWRPKRRELTSCTARVTSCSPLSTRGGTPLRCVSPGEGRLLQAGLRVTLLWATCTQVGPRVRCPVSVSPLCRLPFLCLALPPPRCPGPWSLDF